VDRGPKDKAADPAGLARFLLQAIISDSKGVEHVWTPKADLIFLRLGGAAKKRLREEDLAALARVIERLGASGDREVVVDIR